MPPTKTTINKYGLIMPMVIATVTVLKIPCTMKIVRMGMIKSSTPTSFEKRVTTRPIGFESKNKILARSTYRLMALCMLVVLV